MYKLTVIGLLLTSRVLHAQDTVRSGTSTSTHQQELSFSLYAGVRMQSTPMNCFNFRQIRYDPFIPYNDEANIQQPSLGIRVAAQYGKIAVSYAPFIHYGPLHHYTPNPPVGIGQGYTPKEHKKLLFDQELQVSYYVTSRGKLAPSSFSMAVGVLNTGEYIYLRNGPYDQLLDLQVRNVAGIVGFAPFGVRFPLQFGIHYLYAGIPSNRVDKLLYYSITFECLTLRKRW